MQFTNFNVDTFLSDHWQKKPLFIKNPWPRWRNPLDPNELAGLACEEGVESRLIAASTNDWAVENGPLPENRFVSLGREQWTLLVQAVDHFVPEVAALIEPFRFIPNWRIDDVMVSYAADKGGVGPHFDQYDVFLVQGLGKRRWQIGESCNENTALLPHQDLRLLKDFEPTEEWTCEAGDILYIPPGVSHNGIALGDDCMTYSIGFRAPSQSELIGYWADDLLSELSDDNRYTDPALPLQQNPGQISVAAIDRLHAMVTEKMADRTAFADWFGQYSSTPKYPDVDWRPEAPLSPTELQDAISNGASLKRNPASRFSFFRNEAGFLSLFVDGQKFECTDNLAQLGEKICAMDEISINPKILASKNAMELINALYAQGSLYLNLDHQNRNET